MCSDFMLGACQKYAGVVTISRHFILLNFGTFMQHWSLRKTLSSLGYKTFRVADVGEMRYTLLEILLRTVKHVLILPYKYFRLNIPICGELKSIIQTLRQNLKFFSDYKILIGRFYDQITYPAKLTLVIGSDQVWTNVTPREYGVGFKGKCKRIAYAVSADWMSVSSQEKWKNRIVDELPLFSGISVRELLGVATIKKNLPDLEVFHAIDPVFLTMKEEYLKLLPSAKALNKPAMIYYVVNAKSFDHMNYGAVVEAAKRLQVQLKTIALQGSEKYLPIYVQTVASPREILKLYRDAKYIVTNSFHGTAFAVIFNKQFVCIKQKEQRGCGQNVRCEELLDYLGLSSYMLPNKMDGNSLLKCLEKPIDYSIVDATIAKWREESLSWLKSVLPK